jgi:RNA polymerase sigma-70 factor (ECF subfamily)
MPIPTPLTASSGPEHVYARLRELAAGYLRRERPGHTLQPTALVHEAFLRLLSSGGMGGMAGRDLFCAAARAMRHVLVDSARRHRALKRGAGQACSDRVPIDEVVSLYERSGTDLLALDEALDRLGAIDPELLVLVELRFFGGLTEEQAARHLGVSSRTVARSWKIARAWLSAQLELGDAA